MKGRHVLAMTNSNKAAELIVAAASVDFSDSLQTELVFVERYGYCTQITVDADEFRRWIQP